MGWQNAVAHDADVDADIALLRFIEEDLSFKRRADDPQTRLKTIMGS